MCLLSESSKQRKQRGQQQTRKGLTACNFWLEKSAEGWRPVFWGFACLERAASLRCPRHLVIRLSRARLGVLQLGHVVACVRITSHEILRDGVRAAAAFLLRRPHRAGFLSGSFSSFPRIWLASLIQQKSGPKAPLSPPQMGTKARAGCQVGPGPLPALITVQVGASASAPARRALTLSALGQGGS